MEKKFTFFTRTLLLAVSTFIVLLANSFFLTSMAQVSCPNSLNLFTETFGTGTTPSSSAGVIPGSLTYLPKEPLETDGLYRVVNKTYQNLGWHKSGDHTGDLNGKMLVANGQDVRFYRQIINDSNGFLPGTFSVSCYAMNVSLPGTCSSPVLPIFSFRLEYLDANNAWIPLLGSPSVFAPLPETSQPTWVLQEGLFTLPVTGSFLVTSIRLRISDEAVGGCGNDFAIDDINISQCPAGGPTPVTFLRLSASQRGSGVSISFSTSQELNSDHFDIERSASGNGDWKFVGSLKGAGNSSVLRSYNVNDLRPLAGVNFYRVKQIDRDGRFRYSSTVNVKINSIKTGVSVLANPFHNTLTIDFLSSKDEIISARLVDITGKQVANEKWTISSGNTRKDFSNVSGLQQGMYILSVSNASGEILYNNKVLKQ